MKIRSVQDLKGRQEREKQNPFFAAPDRNRPSKTDRTASFCESATRFVASECANGLELFSLGEFHNQSKAIQPLLFRGVASQVYGFHLPPALDDRSCAICLKLLGVCLPIQNIAVVPIHSNFLHTPLAVCFFYTSSFLFFFNAGTA